MKFLLDTHIWLWNSLQPDRLSPRVARELDNMENEIWLSPVSIWELRLLHNKGRLRLIPDAVSWINDNLTRLNVREAPLTFEVALAISSLKLPHNDPADGFIAATAKVFGLTLVTADEQLGKVTDITVLLNR
ncbi:MAG: type II toxin-antitoxin system VapC family toxin [Candidatus Sulfotelmatobacter sp.]